MECEEKRFRSDLYFRINVFGIHLPPLRERVKDIESLTNYFVQHFSAKINKKPMTYTADFLALLEHYNWTGNIRELKNTIERCVILSDNNELTLENLPFDILNCQSSVSTPYLSAFSMASIEKLHIQKVLNYTKGNKAETARLLEIGLTTLYRKLEEYGIDFK